MSALIERAPAAIERLESLLPREFPERVYTSIRGGVLQQVRKFK
jgi:serine/threonine-protein kinase HipA